jgi:tetratricopeptide (TPR) repeat protein
MDKFSMKTFAKLVEPLNRFMSFDHAVFGLVCALVVGIYCWSAEPGFFESASPRAEDSYYNLLVQGFRSGQLNVKREAPPGLAKLANPYDPAANASYVWDMRYMSYEMSYYKGKLYLYYGVTPALVLFWPYATLTGHYCLHKYAVVIFFALGFLVAAGLLYAIWQRYFTEVSIWVVVAGILALGLATGVLGTLSSCDLHEVPHSCGFAFTMLTLAAIWGALHKPKRQVLWLMLASLAFGLAIGSRPSLLFGIIILLIPVAHTWCAASEPVSPQRIGLLFMAAVGPVLLIGLGLMVYNTLRFDSPFEFGWRYQLTDIQNATAQQFSLHYLWFNLKLYFLETIRWGWHFPFLQAGRLSPLPPNYYGVGGPYCGILCNYPLAWLAFAAPLAWRGRSLPEVLTLRWFVGTALLLSMTCALTLCLFFSGSNGYLPDFLPALMLLAVIGVFGLERSLAGLPAWRLVVRCGWCLLLAYSVAFSIFAGIKSHAYADYILGNSLFHQARNDEAIKYYQKAVALEPESAISHVGLGNAYIIKGELDEAIACYQKALEIEPDNVEVQYDLGCSLIQAGRLAEAIIHFQKAQEIEPGFAEAQDPVVNNNFAWSLATNPDSSNRNGAVAVTLAEAACRRTHYQQTAMVGTLAAAYAEAERFDEAILTAQKACALAEKNGETNFLQMNQELLQLYQNHQPYHDAAGRLSGK